MDTQSTAAEGRFELEEKYRRWKETYLPAGDATATYPLDQQLQALGDERLKAAHEAAMAGLTTGLLFKRGLVNRRSWCEPELSSKQTPLG